MGTITLGSTGIVSEKNAFGALPIQRVSKEEATRILRKAFDAGITFYDTARGYSDSEEKIGYALSDVRNQIHIATKSLAQTAEGFWKDLETSLRYLKTDHIDVFQFHNPSFCPRPGDASGLYDAALKAKEQGKILHVSITNHSLAIANEIVDSGLYETLQFPFSYLASEKDVDLVEKCKVHNMGFICMKAMSGGLITHADAAYAWLNQYEVLPIWGIQRESELDEFISYIDNPPSLTSERIALIETDRKDLQGGFCRGCGYCMPTCPVGIQISTAARMSQLIRRSPSARWLSEDGQELMKKIDDCIDCGVCKSHCPYNLDPPTLIRQHYADYQNILSGVVTI